jgi:hypothetical protein
LKLSYICIQACSAENSLVIKEKELVDLIYFCRSKFLILFADWVNCSNVNQNEFVVGVTSSRWAAKMFSSEGSSTHLIVISHSQLLLGSHILLLVMLAMHLFVVCTGG